MLVFCSRVTSVSQAPPYRAPPGQEGARFTFEKIRNPVAQDIRFRPIRFPAFQARMIGTIDMGQRRPPTVGMILAAGLYIVKSSVEGEFAAEERPRRISAPEMINPVLKEEDGEREQEANRDHGFTGIAVFWGPACPRTNEKRILILKKGVFRWLRTDQPQYS